MSQINQLVGDMLELSDGYQPSPEIADQLRNITMAPIIGPFAIGKTTVMDAACSEFADVGRIHSFTTRDMREGEDPATYDFIDHSESNLRALRDAAQAGKLVQFTVHPTGRVYGSWQDAYRHPYSLLDTMPQALGPLLALPFRDIVKVSLVAAPRQWTSRVQERLVSSGSNDVRKRLVEGISSLEWSLDQGADLMWLDNSLRTPDATASQLIGIIKGERGGDKNARRTGEQLLSYLRSTYADLN